MKARRGVLVRTIPVRLLNVSSTGFLVESQTRIAAGTTGVLDVDAGSTRYLSSASLLRSVFRPGAGQTFLLGGMFTPSAAITRQPTPVVRRAQRRAALPRRAARAPHTSAA